MRPSHCLFRVVEHFVVSDKQQDRYLISVTRRTNCLAMRSKLAAGDSSTSFRTRSGAVVAKLRANHAPKDIPIKEIRPRPGPSNVAFNPAT